MAIGFRASSAAGAASTTQVTSQAITIPAAVAAGDVLVILAAQVPISATSPTLSIASTGTAPVAAAAQQTGSESLPATLGARPWTVVCGAGDAGKVITVTSTTTGFWSLAVAAYTGVDNTTPVDVAGGAVSAGNTATVTCPTETTGSAGDWALFLGGGAGEGGNLTPPSGSTSRESSVHAGTNVFAVIADGNASAGAAGASIGGGTFVTGSATNSLLAAFTIGLKAAGSGTPGAAALAGSGTLSAPPAVTVPAAAALNGSGTLAAGETVTGAGSAALNGSGSLTAGETVTFHGAAALAGSGTLTATGQDIPLFSAVFGSTDGNGVQTWTVTSALNGPSTSVLRILPPTSGSGSYAHSFCFMLPVSTGTDATFGDPLSVMESLGACNAYNTTAVVPSFPIQPWYADNPLNLQQSQESFMLALAAWMSTSSFASGGEKNYLIGFSKSGIGGQGLQFRRPDIWAATASWDAPFCMTDFDGTDPTNGGTVGGNSATCYGTSANFKTNYELSAAHLTTWAAAGGLTTETRLWIGGYFAFQPDVNAYMTRLATAGILFNGAHNTLDSSHAWHNGWVSDALAAIMLMPSGAASAALSGQGSLAAGPRLGTPSALSGQGTFGAAPRLAGSAPLSGSGTFGLSPRLAGAAPLDGEGTLAAGTSFAAGVALSGGGTFAGAGLFPAGVALSGDGSLLAAPRTQLPGAAVFSGDGSLLAGARFGGAVALDGSGSLVVAGGHAGLAPLTGDGSLTASARLPAAVVLAGTGTFGAAPALPAGCLLGGEGTLSGLGTVAGTSAAVLDGTGTLTASYARVIAAAAALSGLGTLTARGAGLSGVPGSCSAADYLACFVLAVDYLAYSAGADDRFAGSAGADD